MRINRRHEIFDFVAFAFDLLIWIVCIIGPYILLSLRQPLLSLAAAAIVIALFTASFRWRTGGGFAMLPGCLGINLLLWNTATVCLVMAILIMYAGLGTLPRITAGLLGIPLVMIYVKIVDAILIVVLGPVKDRSDDRTTPHAMSDNEPTERSE